MYRTILVPLDGSDFAEHAIPFAISIAYRTHGKLDLIRSHSCATLLTPDSQFVVDVSVDEKISKAEADYLEDVVNRVLRTGRIQPSQHLLDSFASEQIGRHAISSHADLIVLATHGRGGLSRFWLGSMSDALIRSLSIPMLLIRPQENKPDLALDFNPRRICIPLDGSELAEQILEPAMALGEPTHAEYVLVRAIEPFLYPPEEFSEVLLDQFLKRAQAYLDGVAEKMRKRSCKVTTRVVMNEPAAATILQAAESQKADVIAVATHGLGGLGRALLGSVADKVIRGTNLPTLVFRPVQA